MRKRMTVHDLMARGLEAMELALRNTETLHTEATVRELLAKAEAERHRDKEAYLALARMAAEVAGRLDGEQALDCQVRAQAEMGNALRKAGRFKESRAVFKRLEDQALAAPPLIRGDALWLHAALCRDERRFDDASDKLATAISLYSAAGNKEKATTAAVSMGCTLIDAGSFRAAQIVLAEALNLLMAEPFDMFLLSLCCGNFVYLLVESAGVAQETEKATLLGTAIASADYTRRVLRGFAPRQYTLQLEWTYARLLRIDGKLEPAEALFDALVHDFTDAGETLYGAVAALDLAELYLDRGRVEELRRLGAACLNIFDAAELRPEFWTAFRLCKAGEELVRLRRLIERTVARCGAPLGSVPRGLNTT